jgi:hypothetical protein
VLHAISVMLVTSFFNHERDGVHQIKQATNTLMASRYGMMSDLYRHLFAEPCTGIHDIGLAERYRLHDRRIADALIQARRQVDPARVVDGKRYRASETLPFVFSNEQ